MKKVLPAIIVLVLVVVGVIFYFVGKQNTASDTNSSTSGSSSSQMENMPNGSNKPQNQANTTPEAANTDKVTIKNLAFSPANITVKKGTTVTWTNQDSTAHTVTETDGQDGPNSGNLAKGQSYSFTFNTVGTFKYDCSIHTYMTGTVTVTE